MTYRLERIILIIVFQFVSLSIYSEEIEGLHSLLPVGETINHIEKLQGGFSNNVWKINGESGEYLFRQAICKENSDRFAKMIEILSLASNQDLAPEVIGVNFEKQQILLRYIESEEWPTFKNNPQPYYDTIRTIKQFHEIMQERFDAEEGLIDFPFSFIFEEGTTLIDQIETPSQFAVALKKTAQIYEKLKPWLKENAVICHGDCHQKNVLLKRGDLKPILIDFDSFTQGDPYLDVIKFTITLPKEDREKLFSAYLGKERLSPDEKEHFDLMDLTFLMVVTINRFKLAKPVDGDIRPRLSKDEMETILQSDLNTPLPSFLSMAFEDQSPISRQLGALYALAEFLRNVDKKK